MDDVPELSHVAGPRIARQPLQRRIGEPLALAFDCAELLEKRLRQERHVVAALPQRGETELEHFQPVVQVFAQLALRRWRRCTLRLVAARMRTSTEMGSFAARRARTVPVSSTRSSLTCSSIGISVISSRNNVPRARALEVALVTAIGAGEAPALVSEQLALHQRRRDRAAVHRQEGPSRRRLSS